MLSIFFIFFLHTVVVCPLLSENITMKATSRSKFGLMVPEGYHPHHSRVALWQTRRGQNTKLQSHILSSKQEAEHQEQAEVSNPSSRDILLSTRPPRKPHEQTKPATGKYSNT